MECNLLSQSNNIESVILKSLENSEYRVNIITDNANGRIIIELGPEDRVCINNFRGFQRKANILKSIFIELVIKLPGGTGTSVRRYVLVCVSRGKLYKAIDVISEVNSVVNVTKDHSVDSLKLYEELSFYKLDFKLAQNEYKTIQLVVYEYEKFISNFDPKRNHEVQDSLVLDFNKKKKVFYNGSVLLNGDFVINNDNEGTISSTYLKYKKVPAIKLRGAEYYFMNHSWFYNVLFDGSNNLTEFSDSCD